MTDIHICDAVIGRKITNVERIGKSVRLLDEFGDTILLISPARDHDYVCGPGGRSLAYDGLPLKLVSVSVHRA